MTVGFPLEAVDRICRCTKEVQRLLPLLCRMLRLHASRLWIPILDKSRSELVLDHEAKDTDAADLSAKDEAMPEYAAEIQELATGND